MAGLTWLHLSDWHQWGKKFERHVVLDKILEDIRAREQTIHPDLAKLDLIIFNGDVAFSGKKEEYQAAIDTLFNPLLEATGLTPDRLFIVPGNHDFDRNEMKYLPEGIKQPFESSELLNDWLTNERERKFLLAPFVAYEQFVSDLTGQAQASYAHIREIEVSGKKVALLGCNSALMCNRHVNEKKETADRDFLVIGEPQIHDQLNKIADAEVRIAVVHHPFDWLTDFDRDIVEDRLKRACHFILCGHLHKQKVTLEKGTVGECLTISAGALYDGRIPHNPRYTNAYNFAHLDFENGLGAIYLRRWSEINTCWIADTESFDKGYYKFPLPETIQRTEMISAPTNSTPSLTLSDEWNGWSLLNKEYLDKIRATGEMTPEQVIRYFDGMIPNWKCALTLQIPRRSRVDELRKQLSRLEGKDQPHVTVLLGGGGEGKSTVLRQVVCDLLEKEAGWHVLWHEKQEAPLSSELLRELPPVAGSWLVVSDDAESIVKDVYQSIRMLHEQEPRSIHFLLCCRDTDWRESKANTLAWHSIGAKCESFPLEGLTLEDATKIVERWEECGRGGMRDLYGLSVESAAKKLHSMAVEEAARKERGGSFLGAMIRARFSTSIEDHVQEMLNRLNRPTPLKTSSGSDLTLLYAYAHIAVLHKMNFLALTEKILARALKCNQAELYEYVIGPLGVEAAISTAPPGEIKAVTKGEVILTRHRAIAEITVKLFRRFHYRVEDVTDNLLRSATDILQKHELSVWRSLPSRFADEGDYRTAIRLGETWIKKEPQNVLHVNYLAHFYRDNQQPEEAVRVFRDAFHKLPKRLKDKLYYHEWATAEAEAGEVYASIWLNGAALANGGPPNPERNDKYTPADLAKICLNGLSIVFGRIFRDKRDPAFSEAWVAATRLGMKLAGSDLTTGTDRKLGQSLASIKEQKLEVKDSFNLHEALDVLKKGIYQAWLRREDQLPLREAGKLEFTDLVDLFL